ncbi:MAG TPA: acetoacetate decarboxylase family protein, partial [bacterium]|nr:acetoacetate decarboxylase family protein [bacterium]
MPPTYYHFRNAVSAFFEMPAAAARKLLPAHLQPLELRHESGVLAITAFDFTESMVGAYQEIVLAVIVPPLAKPGGAFPRSAFYPFLLGTSTPESRAHAIERWHLPHHMAEIQMEFEEGDGKVDVAVREGAASILDLSVVQHDWSEVDHL